MMLQGIENRVKINGKTWINLLSPILLNSALEKLIRETNVDRMSGLL